MSDKTIRPTKKQREILSYIEQFIGEHGYSPSYREIMNGLNYTSVATVSLHVNSLIKRGHLRKRDRSARSLEVVGSNGKVEIDSKGPVQKNTEGQQWLTTQVDAIFSRVETSGLPAAGLANLANLVRSLRILGLEVEAESFAGRLTTLEQNPAVQAATDSWREPHVTAG